MIWHLERNNSVAYRSIKRRRVALGIGRICHENKQNIWQSSYIMWQAPKWRERGESNNGDDEPLLTTLNRARKPGPEA